MTTRTYVGYCVRAETGDVVASSEISGPLIFPACGGALLPGIARAAERLMPGDDATVQLEPDDAYGAWRESLVFPLPSDRFDRPPEIGQFVRLGRAPARVVERTDSIVTVDANHPLAGTALTVSLRGVEPEPDGFDLFTFIEGAPWRFARTMPHIPHWYTVRGQTNHAEFEAFVRLIRTNGYPGQYRGPRNRPPGSTNRYYRFGNWKYWTMGSPVPRTIIINRARVPATPPWAWEPVEPDETAPTAEEIPLDAPADDGDALSPEDIPAIAEEVVIASVADAASRSPLDIRLSRYGVLYCTCAEWSNQGIGGCDHLRQWAIEQFGDGGRL